MSRKYTKIEQYKNQILSMKKEGKTQREIAEKFRLEKEHHGGYTGGRRFFAALRAWCPGRFFRPAQKTNPPHQKTGAPSLCTKLSN